jgi:hypothetical protein
MVFVRFRRLPSIQHRNLASAAAALAATVAAVLALSVSGAEAMSIPHPPAPCRCTTYCGCLDGCCPRRVCTGNCNPVFGDVAPGRTPGAMRPATPVVPPSRGRLR